MKNKIKDKNFFNKHKKGVYITIGMLGGLVFCFFGVKFFLKRPSLDNFLKEPINVLKNKREEIHNECLNYTINDNYRNTLWKLLSVLDNEIQKRENNGKIPSPPSYPREHGHGLYKKD